MPLPRGAEHPEAPTIPQSAPSAFPPSLPPRYSPVVAGYARGPFLDPVTVTPSDWRWRNTRTAVVRDRDGHDYRAIRVYTAALAGMRMTEFVGWWAVELLGVPLIPREWEP